MTSSNNGTTNGGSHSAVMFSSPPSQILTPDEAEAAIQSFCDFLRFETVSRTAAESGAYQACATWLVDYVKDVVDTVFLLDEAPEHSPVVIGCWKGRDESLPVLLLNSHYDVVPAMLEAWTVPPFDAIRKDSKIYGRGTQDMKCVCIQYVEAIRKIKTLYPDYQPERSIYLTFVPDEGESKSKYSRV